MNGISRTEQATAAWEPILRDARRRGRRKTVIRDGPWLFARRTTLWPLSQVLQAAVDLTAIDLLGVEVIHRLLLGLEDHRNGNAYDSGPGNGERYYDDNAWLALALLDAAEVGLAAGVETARRLLGFLREGEREGGIYWVEGPRRTRHTCSTAPAAEVALRLALLDVAGAPRGEANFDAELRFAAAAMAFLERELLIPDGLFMDNIRDDGVVEPALWSYNQGTPVGAYTLWHRLTGEGAPLEKARKTAAAAVDYFGKDDRLWRQPPVFNAVFLRNLLLLDEAASFPAAAEVLGDYLDRAWSDARDTATGWFTGGGIGSYGRGGSIDQAAFAQLFARAARRQG